MAKKVAKLLALVLSLVATVAVVQAAQLDWQKDWEQTLAAARKEGQVNIYVYRYEGLLQEFKREFPGINIVAVTGRGNRSGRPAGRTGRGNRSGRPAGATSRATG
jgi:hypothetical protein